jgi:hypothetical protein
MIRPIPASTLRRQYRQLLHDDEAGTLQMLDKPPRHYLRHDLIGVVEALASLKAQGERIRVGEVFETGGRLRCHG